jgi:rod shape-determining protein MreD
MQPIHSSRRILLPVRNWFIVLTLFLALLLNLIPFGRLPGIPDWVALVLAFWCVHQPLKVGMAAGFVLGLAMDVADASVMGQHALAYVLLAFAAAGWSRRVLWFPLSQQALHVLPLLLLVQLVQFAVRAVPGVTLPGWGYFIGPLFGALLWWPLTFVLLLPQYQPVDRDANRPI